MKDLLEKSKLTQVELAKVLNVTQQTVSNWCLGKSKPTVTMLFKLSKVLNVTVQEVVDCFK